MPRTPSAVLSQTSLAGKHSHYAIPAFLIAKYRNYDHVAELWQHEDWLPAAAVQQAKSHYSAYSVQRADGLRVISLNTNLCECLLFFYTCDFVSYIARRVQVSNLLNYLLSGKLMNVQGKLLQLHQHDGS